MTTKYLIVVFTLFGLLFYYSCTEDSDLDFPDFSKCQCDTFARDIVCGSDGRTYLDSCLAACLKVDILMPGNCRDASNDSNDTLRWPIEMICIPIVKESDPQEIRTLSDGTVLYQNQDGSFFRGTSNLCRCLPPSTLISTPSGQQTIATLRIGDLVWTRNVHGEQVIRPIAFVGSIAVPQNHQVLHMVLDDGRQLSTSPLHPDVDNNPLVYLKKGSCYDNAIIIRSELKDYGGERTWDLLPEGETGLYWANNILISSTLKTNQL